MQDLLEYIIKGITGSDDFEIEEIEDNGRITFNVYADPEIIGLIIGKDGKTIKSIRNIIKVPSTLEKKLVYINIEEK